MTVDEGGGYYDSGYVQPLDFLGDGPRIPVIVVSPFTKPGHISQSYADHLDMEVHRAQLGSSSDQLTQPRQFAKPEVALGQPVRSGKQSGNQRSV